MQPNPQVMNLFTRSLETLLKKDVMLTEDIDCYLRSEVVAEAAAIMEGIDSRCRLLAKIATALTECSLRELDKMSPQ